MDDERIRALEAEAKRLEAAQTATEARRDAWSAPAPETPRSPESFAAMMTMFSGMQMSSYGWLLGMATLFLVIGGLVGRGGIQETENALILVMLGLFGTLPWLFFLAGLVRWPAYRRWRERLPFALLGKWDELAASKEEDHWHHTRVDVVLSRQDAKYEAAIGALLRIFSVHANRSHFRPASFGGSLAPWAAKGLTAEGDVGGRVGWKLYRFISGELAQLTRSGAPISEVRLVVGKPHKVRAEIDTS